MNGQGVHWPWWATVWTIVAILLMAFCWWLALRAKTANRAKFAMPLGILVALYGPAPVSIRVADQHGLAGVMCIYLPAILLGVGPMYIIMRRHGAEADRARQARADQAENVIRKLGA